MLNVAPAISTRTAVSTGGVSSRAAATATWATAEAKTSPGMVPKRSGGGGSCGYSSTGITGSAKRLDPASMRSLAPSRLIVTGLLGRVRAMSARSRPCTRTRPSSASSAVAVIRADTS